MQSYILILWFPTILASFRVFLSIYRVKTFENRKRICIFAEK